MKIVKIKQQAKQGELQNRMSKSKGNIKKRETTLLSRYDGRETGHELVEEDGGGGGHGWEGAGKAWHLAPEHRQAGGRVR